MSINILEHNYKVNAYRNKLEKILQTYEEVIILDNGSVEKKLVKTDYLLKNDVWSYDFFVKIPQFTNRLLEYRKNPVNHIFIIKFNSPNEIINLELKCLYKFKLFNDEWSIYSCFQKHTHRYRVINFMKLFYPNLDSIMMLNINEAEKKYINWLQETGIPITEQRYYKGGRKNQTSKVRTAGFLQSAYNSLTDYLDDRPIWSKDIWKLKDFQEQFAIEFHKSTPQGFIRFDKIKNNSLKEILKMYIKDRLLGKRQLSWATGKDYTRTIGDFFNVISSNPYEKELLKKINRQHILKFIEERRIYYSQNNLVGVDNYLNKTMSQLRTFLLDLQTLNHPEAPLKSVQLLINESDFPKYKKVRTVRYIDDKILK